MLHASTRNQVIGVNKVLDFPTRSDRDFHESAAQLILQCLDEGVRYSWIFAFLIASDGCRKRFTDHMGHLDKLKLLLPNLFGIVLVTSSLKRFLSPSSLSSLA